MNPPAESAEGRALPQVRVLEHLNLTPYPSQYFQTVDKDGEVFHVVALRVTYDMTLTAHEGTLVYAKEQSPLVAQDVWSGEVNESCPLWESDFAPYKPKCDVLVANAVSRPPKDQWAFATQGLAKRWPCGVGVQWKNEKQQTQNWYKALTVTGERSFGMSGLSAPKATNEVAITWEKAYGGQIKNPEQDVLHPDGSIKTKAGAKQWQTDERNPVGVGKRTNLGAPGPQLEVMNKTFSGGVFSSDYPPISLTPVGRAWAPRSALAGTYDDAWRKNQWPLPPQDFDYAYWNCAPLDQQLDYLPPGSRITLVNLYGAHRPSQQETWSAQLPQTQFFVRWRRPPGEPLNQPLNLDTLVIDMASQQIYATYRALISAQAAILAVATDMESDPAHIQQLKLRARKG